MGRISKKRSEIANPAKACVVVAAGLAVLLIGVSLYVLASSDGFKFWFLVPITVCSALLCVRFPFLTVRSGGVGFSLADCSVFAGLLVAGPLAAALLAALEGLVVSVRFRVRNPYRIAFNLSHNTLSVLAVGSLFYVTGWTGRNVDQLITQPQVWLTLIVLALLYVALSTASVSTITRLAAQDSAGSLWGWLMRTLAPFSLVQVAIALLLLTQVALGFGLAFLGLVLSYLALERIQAQPATT